jgi:hypothetical protein
MKEKPLSDIPIISKKFRNFYIEQKWMEKGENG